nr:immunoglobulin light chain junction region [Macaca mulatta]MOX69112.1 immunoglobulin light chain junction region [Macaca mulatta]MOX69320.1 immunoglobulin light chain junction region [Macaca mulatta]MOX69340.1 immunoglobulin light chain junction region [Macaca mulatta]MOX69611.1 immunoglobulin light chain junction region [Macaca mulatta]
DYYCSTWDNSLTTHIF